MDTFAKYTITETDNFDELLYPQVAGEIDGLQGRLCEIKGANKVSIIISSIRLFFSTNILTKSWEMRIEMKIQIKFNELVKKSYKIN